MKIQHIPRDNVVRIKYEDELEKVTALNIARIVSEELGIEVEELKQTG